MKPVFADTSYFIALINPTDVGGTSLAIDIPQELIDRLLGRTTDFSI